MSFPLTGGGHRTPPLKGGGCLSVCPGTGVRGQSGQSVRPLEPFAGSGSRADSWVYAHVTATKQEAATAAIDRVLGAWSAPTLLHPLLQSASARSAERRDRAFSLEFFCAEGRS